MTIFPSKKVQIRDASIGVGIFISTLLFYYLTSYPTVAYIDSGELAIVNWSLGIAHPTGYPLYTLLGRLFALLPLELMKTQIIFGAVSTATAVVIFFFTVKSVLTGIRWSSPLAGLSALLIAVAPLVWSQGITNEVYSLHLLFISGLLFLLLQQYSHRRLLLMAYLFGLSFGNHMSTVLLLPTLFCYTIINRREVFDNLKVILQSMLLFLSAVSAYLYLPIRASQQPLFNWGNPVNWDNLIRHISGWQYQVWMFDQSAAELLNQARNLGTTLLEQFPWVFLPFLVVGFYFMVRRKPEAALYLVLLVISNLIYTLNFSIPDIDNYLLPTVVSLYLISAYGLRELAAHLRYLALTIVVVSLCWQIVGNWENGDRSGNYAAADGVANYYRSIERNSLILSANWDYVSPWYYSHFYLAERPDVIVVDIKLVRRTWYFDWIRQADSALFEFIRPEVEAFLPHVRRFETKLTFNRQEIERTYQAILTKLMAYPGKLIYFDQSVDLRLSPASEIAVSGQLFRLLRPGEKFESPDIHIPPPRFGKAEANLDWREKWHLQLHKKVWQMEQQIKGQGQ